MTVKEILSLVCEFVGEREIAEKFSTEGELTTAEKAKVQLMTRCFNLVNQEIASDYLPFLIKEEIDVQDSVLNYSNLKKKVVHIYEVKNRFGMNLKFRCFPNYVQIFGHAKSIVYSYLPEELDLENEVDMPCALSVRVYAYGIASEYLLIDGLSDDAEIWENRFKDSLFMLSRKHGEHVLPRRGWF